MAVVEFYAFGAAFVAFSDLRDLIGVVPISRAKNFEIIGICLADFEEFIIVFVVGGELRLQENSFIRTSEEESFANAETLV